METLSKITLKQHHHQPFFFNSIQQNRPLFFSKPTLVSSLKINSSSQKSNSISVSKNPFNFLKTPLTVAVATAAIFFSGLSQRSNVAVAETRNNVVEETTMPSTEDEDNERKLEEHVTENPNDVEALKSLMEVRIKNKKLAKAVEVINKLVEIEPQEKEWLLLRAHMYSYMGETELAKAEFEDIIAKEPARVEAYHGLVMAVSQGEEGSGELDVVSGRIKEAIEKCRKEKRKDEVRDFRLLIAQVRVIEGNYDEALRIYQELVKEDPRDFRPYLCQGIIYTLMRKKDEADKQFEKYKRLVPQEHPYAQFFDDNMIATKAFSQMAENERGKVGATS
ncbi:hypothetical protein vseg_004208 [Gypsophila vaccaria]